MKGYYNTYSTRVHIDKNGGGIYQKLYMNFAKIYSIKFICKAVKGAYAEISLTYENIELFSENISFNDDLWNEFELSTDKISRFSDKWLNIKLNVSFFGSAEYKHVYLDTLSITETGDNTYYPDSSCFAVFDLLKSDTVISDEFVIGTNTNGVVTAICPNEATAINITGKGHDIHQLSDKYTINYIK